MSTPAHSHAHTAPPDEMDPHHEVRHHGHVILSPATLVGVLAALLFFTILTVAIAVAEGWIASSFGVHIPHLVNVLVAMSIATVKGALVAMYFMQLKYDNPLNTIVFLFCLFAFGLFLTFTMTDLGTRSVIYRYKAGEIQVGGTGLGGGKGAVQQARLNRIAKIGEENANGTLVPPLAPGETPEQRFLKEKEAAHAGGHHHHAGPVVSTAHRSIPQSSEPTPGLFAPGKAGDAGHHHGGGGH